MAHLSRNTARGSYQNGEMHGSVSFRDAPPSTLAANLTSNISTHRRSSRHDDQDDFQQLLLGVARYEEKPPSVIPLDEKLSHCQELVYVVVIGVLEPLIKTNVSGNEQDQLQKASEGLEVLTGIIKDVPIILDHVPGQRVQLLSGSDAPLWIWLFPKVLALVGSKRCESLGDKMREFFKVSFREVSKTLQLWALNSVFFSYLKHCANSILDHLNESKVTGTGHLPELKLTLPVAESKDELFTCSNLDIDMEMCTYSLYDADHALRHAYYLLVIIVDVSSSAAGSLDTTPFFSGHLAWILDGFVFLRESERAWGPPAVTQESAIDTCILSIRSVHSLLLSMGGLLPNTLQCKGYSVLAQLCTELCDYPNALSETSIENTFCTVVLDLVASCACYEPVAQAVRFQLLPAIQIYQDSQAEWESQPSDIVKCIAMLRNECQGQSSLYGSDLSGLSEINDPCLVHQLRHLKFTESAEAISDGTRPAKRRKILNNRDVLNEVVRETYLLLGSQSAGDLDGLQHVVSACFAQLSDADRCRAMVQLGYIPCASAGSLELSFDREGNVSKRICSICESGSLRSATEMNYNGTLATEAIATFAKLIDLPDFEESGKPRVQAMVALRHFVMHFTDNQFLNLETSSLGQWCLKSLRSSIRELRIAAGRTLPLFLRSNIDEEVLRKNKKNVLEFLRILSDQCQPHITETCILAWGQVARVSEDRELNLVLLRLVEYLGHTNQIASGAAFNEIMGVSDTLDMPIGQMFKPFWRSIGPIAVKDLQSRPQTAQLVADLLKVSVSELLISIQADVLPWLVLTKKQDVISRIAQARGESDPGEACLEGPNRGPIMALLLVQNVPDLESFVTALYKDISPLFDSFRFVDLLIIEPMLIAVELLQSAGEEDDSKRSRVRHALQILASRTYNGAENGHKRGNLVGPFLEQNILAIVVHFSNLLKDGQGWQSPWEKRRALKGIEEMFRVGKGYVRSALPQICACLQSALVYDEIRSTAFSAWRTMICSLDDEDAGPLLETTFSTIILKWANFDSISRTCAVELITHLLKQRHDLVREFIELIPSIGQISELSEYEVELKKMRADIDVRQRYRNFKRRIGHEHESVVTQALIELTKYLRQHQGFLQASAISEQPERIIGELLRSILDASVKFSESNIEIARLSAECIGLIGCLDSNRVECIRDHKEIVVVSNFGDPEETAEFALFLLENVLVKAFLSATDPRAQGYLSYAMQELLEKCEIKEACASHQKGMENSSLKSRHLGWLRLPETVRQTLTPFLKSRYRVGEMARNEAKYPIFEHTKKFTAWLKVFVLDLLKQPHNSNALVIFTPLCRIIKIDDISVASFLLPYVVLHAVVLGTVEQRESIRSEFLRVLSHQTTTESHLELTNTKLCSDAVFRILDYLSRWMQEMQARLGQKKVHDTRGSISDDDLTQSEHSVQEVRQLLSSIPAEVISRRAVECESYARALFHWEEHIRQLGEKTSSKVDINPQLKRLQDIYTEIDEPDGIEGIAAHLHVLDIDQQILGHRKAGRWTAAQSWYEIKLATEPENVDAQVDLLCCLKDSGQYDALLNYIEGMHKSGPAVSKLLPFATEACWAIGRWDTLQKYILQAPSEIGGDFNVSVGRILLAIHGKNFEEFSSIINVLREQIACSLSLSTTSSLSVCRETMLKLHILTELEMIADPNDTYRKEVLVSLDKRLEAFGAYLNDKQYLLGIRRAAMQLTSPTYTKGDIASAWLTSARLARKGNSLHQSFNAVLRASQLGDESATIEHARLLWKEGQHRKAIQSLQGAIDTNAFTSHNYGPVEDQTSFTAEGLANQQNLLTARAHLLLAKWLDSAGHTHSTALRSQYQHAARMHSKWEKGHYYLGRHYNKLLESEKALPSEQQAQSYLIGETAKLVIENYLRSLTFGTKYVYQTLPRVLTLWLDLGVQVNQPMEAKYGTKEFVLKISTLRKEQLTQLHHRFAKYIQKMPAYIYYTALPQIVARIAHPNAEVYQFLQQIIVKVVSTHPQQALWTLLAVSTSNQPDRKTRGMTILATLRNTAKKADLGSYDLKSMIKSGERLASQLLMVCNAGEFQGNRTLPASITRDLGFNHKICTPSPLCVPVESALTATLPTLTDGISNHKAFSRDVVTVSQFLDEVLVLSSLQKPRKLTARGSDGKDYGLLCKPKDDLRKDQRLMEFNSMINRSLKRDAESSKRQLYIKTYAVTPLNEECGIIEWVNGLKTLRDILLTLYRIKGITPNYAELKVYLDEASKYDEKLPLFTEKVLRGYPPVFHSWFVQQFPEPSAWFVARLKYTRSCAVMSMVGTILGLGDRHGENILFEEGNGGTFHVDFNCLFDKGLTFAQPERVPFRLTHNMVNAMGVYGYEGPFRKSSELTLALLRQHEETLMTILEAFVYDPTLDLLAKKNEKKKREAPSIVPDTAQGVLDSIRRKVRGLLAGESVPLGVEGQVDELIKQAVSPKNLAAMYIGWCAFF